MEENPIYLPEPGASELPVSRKALIFDETIEQVFKKLYRRLHPVFIRHNTFPVDSVGLEEHPTGEGLGPRPRDLPLLHHHLRHTTRTPGQGSDQTELNMA